MRTYLKKRNVSQPEEPIIKSNHSTEDCKEYFNSPSSRIPAILLSSPNQSQPQTTTSPAKDYSDSSAADKSAKKARLITDFFPTIHQSSRILDTVHTLKQHSTRARNSSRTSLDTRKTTQLYLGSNFDKVQQCKECGMSFIPHNSLDLQAHASYHSFTLNGIPVGNGFSVYSKRVYRADKLQPSKLQDLLWLMDRDLGACQLSADQLNRSKIWVYVEERRVLGAVVAEQITNAFPETDLSTVRPAVCGISRIWVCPRARRRGVGRQLLRAVCEEFVYGMQIDPCKELAFSQPTQLGRQLARSFTGSQDILVYREQ